MSTRTLAAILLTTVVASIGCAKPVLTRRYESVAPPSSGALNVTPRAVELTASVFPIDPPAQRTIFDLASEGQAAMVAAVAAQASGGSALHHALAAPITRASSGVVDRTSVSRRVVLSVSTDHAGLADRLDFSSVALNLAKGAQVKFTAWNQLATKFDAIDLGKLTFTQKDSLTFGLEGVLPGINEITNATIGGTRDRNLGEEVQLRQRYVATTGSLTPLVAKIVQQGAVGIDLIGNTVFDVSLSSTRVQQERLFSADGLFKNGKAALPAEVTLNRRLIRYAETAADWTVDLTAEFRRRRVAAGDRTVTESDDIVAYESIAPRGTSLTLVDGEDLKVSKWMIYDPACQPIHVQEHSGPMPLQFDSFDGAEEMLKWLLETNAERVAGRPLGFFTGLGVSAPTGTPRWVGLRVEISGLNWAVQPGSCAK